MNHVRAGASHSALAILEAGILAFIVLTLVVAPALAAKGGNGKGPGKPGGGDGSSSLAVRMVVDQNGDGAPNWSDQVTFDVTTSATDRPWVRLDCHQAGAWVSTTTHGFFAEYPWPPNYTLASGGWLDGQGDCTATLYLVASNGRTRNLSSLTFHVAA